MNRLEKNSNVKDEIKVIYEIDMSMTSNIELEKVRRIEKLEKGTQIMKIWKFSRNFKDYKKFEEYWHIEVILNRLRDFVTKETIMEVYKMIDTRLHIVIMLVIKEITTYNWILDKSNKNRCHSLKFSFR